MKINWHDGKPKALVDPNDGNLPEMVSGIHCRDFGGGDGGGGASTSSSTATTTTQISDSYNQTRYDTTSVSNVGNLSAGATFASGSIVSPGAMQAGGNIATNFGNLYLDSPGAGTSGGAAGILDAIKPYLLYILAGAFILGTIYFLRK